MVQIRKFNMDTILLSNPQSLFIFLQLSQQCCYQLFFPLSGIDPCLPLLYFPTTPNTFLNAKWVFIAKCGQLLPFLTPSSKGTQAFPVHWHLLFGYLVWCLFLRLSLCLNLMKVFPSIVVISTCCQHFIIISLYLDTSGDLT